MKINQMEHERLSNFYWRPKVAVIPSSLNIEISDRATLMTLAKAICQLLICPPLLSRIHSWKLSQAKCCCTFLKPVVKLPRRCHTTASSAPSACNERLALLAHTCIVWPGWRTVNPLPVWQSLISLPSSNVSTGNGSYLYMHRPTLPTHT